MNRYSPNDVKKANLDQDSTHNTVVMLLVHSGLSTATVLSVDRQESVVACCDSGLFPSQCQIYRIDSCANNCPSVS